MAMYLYLDIKQLNSQIKALAKYSKGIKREIDKKKLARLVKVLLKYQSADKVDNVFEDSGDNIYKLLQVVLTETKPSRILIYPGDGLINELLKCIKIFDISKSHKCINTLLKTQRFQRSVKCRRNRKYERITWSSLYWNTKKPQLIEIMGSINLNKMQFLPFMRPDNDLMAMKIPMNKKYFDSCVIDSEDVNNCLCTEELAMSEYILGIVKVGSMGIRPLAFYNAGHEEVGQKAREYIFDWLKNLDTPGLYGRTVSNWDIYMSQICDEIVENNYECLEPSKKPRDYLFNILYPEETRHSNPNFPKIRYAKSNPSEYQWIRPCLKFYSEKEAQDNEKK